MKLLKPEQFPKVIQVGEESYVIVFAKKLKQDDMGVCDDDMKLVILSRKQDIEELNATFWHEMLHAFEKEMKLKLGHKIITKLEWFIVKTLMQLP